MGGPAPVARWGLPLSVQKDGSFEFPGFVPGTSYIRAVAKGYSSAIATGEESDGVVDFGDVALVQAKDLTIRLDPPERAEGAMVLTRGAAQLPGKPFEDGVAVYGGVAAGTYMVTVTEKDETESDVEIELALGEDWTKVIRIAGPNRLSVHVGKSGENGLSRVTAIKVSYESEQGLRTIRSKYPENYSDGDTLEFEGIDAPTVTVRVLDLDGATTTASGAFDHGQLDLQLSLSDETFELRVVDPKGEPVPDLKVVLHDPGQPGFFLFGRTDAQGVATLQGVPRTEVEVSLQHESRGTHHGIRVDARAESAELVFDPSARIELQFLDETLPLQGVAWRIVDASGTTYQECPASDEAGRATAKDLGADTYRLHATRPDCWPVEFEAEARAEGGLTPVQMRRVGSLELEVTASNGLPAAGLEVDLTSLEFDGQVSDWISAARVRSEGLVTDIHGRIHVDGLPHGPYRWTVSATSGETLEGTFELEPGPSHLPVRILLP